MLTLLSVPPEDRDLDLADAMYEAVTQLILTDVPTVPGKHDRGDCRLSGPDA
ncbi:hypothetical protein [Nonomuraea sp. NPDC049784]|uniref:hypothetical protein n=1 Tax=Nonomuraea sp. NPDC049784 TaxID=3154361 RepID=UPI0033CC84AA